MMEEFTQGVKTSLKTMSTGGVFNELQYEVSVTNYWYFTG